MKQVLEEKNQHKLEVRETLLMTIAMLGLHMQSPSAHLTVLFVLIGHLGDGDPGIGSCAAELLLCKCYVPTLHVKDGWMRRSFFWLCRCIVCAAESVAMSHWHVLQQTSDAAYRWVFTADARPRCWSVPKRVAVPACFHSEAILAVQVHGGLYVTSLKQIVHVCIQVLLL